MSIRARVTSAAVVFAFVAGCSSSPSPLPPGAQLIYTGSPRNPGGFPRLDRAGTYYLYDPAQRRLVDVIHFSHPGEIEEYSIDTTIDLIEVHFVPASPPPPSPS